MKNIEIQDLKQNISNFAKLGLLLREEFPHYLSTPKNAIVFATTGGDGVHYGQLPDNRIVMTVPMNFGSENYIVGANLHEFLCLGYFTGYFVLEQLSYSPNLTVVECYSQLIEELLKENVDNDDFNNAIKTTIKIYNLHSLSVEEISKSVYPLKK